MTKGTLAGLFQMAQKAFATADQVIENANALDMLYPMQNLDNKILKCQRNAKLARQLAREHKVDIENMMRADGTQRVLNAAAIAYIAWFATAAWAVPAASSATTAGGVFKGIMVRNLVIQVGLHSADAAADAFTTGTTTKSPLAMTPAVLANMVCAGLLNSVPFAGEIKSAVNAFRIILLMNHQGFTGAVSEDRATAYAKSLSKEQIQAKMTALRQTWKSEFRHQAETLSDDLYKAAINKQTLGKLKQSVAEEARANAPHISWATALVLHLRGKTFHTGKDGGAQKDLEESIVYSAGFLVEAMVYENLAAQLFIAKKLHQLACATERHVTPENLRSM